MSAYDEIAAKAHALNLGAPHPDTPQARQTAPASNEGIWQRFERGWVYWSPTTGAHALVGAILAKYVELDAEQGLLGFPTTDETTTPDGVGRFNHFQGGSIYWTPHTGAHEVHGAIRACWATLGWERSVLGYPTSDETATPDGTGRFNRFAFGEIDWTPETGARVRHTAGSYDSIDAAQRAADAAPLDAPWSMPSSTVVTIRPADQPLHMEPVQTLLARSLDWSTRPTVWTPPREDAGHISKADYIDALRPYFAYYERSFAQEPPTPQRLAYEAVPIFVAFWKATGDSHYADLALGATREYCLSVDQEVAEHTAEMARTGAARPNISLYWMSAYAYLFIPLLALRGTPQFTVMADLLGRSLGARANAWPIYWERGAYARPMYAAFWYDLALRYNPTIPRAAELQTYADLIWNDWWPHRDIEEDDSHYAAIDVMVLDAWALVRGVNWWEESAGQNLWRHYAEQITNDGTWPAYGDGGVHGKYFVALRVAELAASRLRHGVYKWLAHRAFWNGHARLARLSAGIGYEGAMDLAMAYLYADDTVKEVPPAPGLTTTRRRFRQRTDWTRRAEDESGFLFQFHDRWAPSKLIFRAGVRETDQCLVVQAASKAGHGHPDVGNIIHYGGDFGYHLCHGVSRLDYAMEQHNMFVLRDPAADAPWKASYFVSEGTDVPVQGHASHASYARLHVEEFPGTTTTEERWQQVRVWSTSGYPPEWAPPQAIGYQHWPLRFDRSILFVHNQFTVVRDVIDPLLKVHAQGGQNWLVGELGPSMGTHWINTWIPGVYGFPYVQPPLAPVDLVPRDLLIWFVPHPDAVLQIVDGPRASWYGNYYINLPRRVWYPRTATWSVGECEAFTTVLMPHAPEVDPGVLAGHISVVQDVLGATVLKITGDLQTHYIILNTARELVTVGALITDAEAAVVTVMNERPTHIAAWQVMRLALAGQEYTSATPMDIDTPIRAAGSVRIDAG